MDSSSLERSLTSPSRSLAIRGDTALDKVLPSVHKSGLPPGVIGCWRSHIKALSMVIEQGLSTALIFEDDLDWDVRLKQQLQDFAVSSTYLLEHNWQPPSQTRFRDINEEAGAIRMEAFPHNIRHSVRLNMPQMPAGSTGYVGQWPDS